MKRYIFIGGTKKKINTNFKGKSPYIRNLYKKQRDYNIKIGIKKEEAICEKIFKKDIFQRDYSFFAYSNPFIIETKKLPKLNVASFLKYSIISPEEKYYFNKQEKEDKFFNIYKNNNSKFSPRAIKNQKSKNKKLQSKSYLYLPCLQT